MAKTKVKPVMATTVLSDLEILHCSYTGEGYPDVSAKDFSFLLNIENTIDGAHNLVLSVVSVGITTAKNKQFSANIAVKSVYRVENLQQFLDVNKQGKYEIANDLIEKLNAISISTTRGVMFSSFRGTSLHHAILPLAEMPKMEMVEKK
ncbi:MAG: hypothetical protein LRY55_06060 [Leadbetterella sp.]|nr:hypothetical protein [Leadbetterella sp.]